MRYIPEEAELERKLDEIEKDADRLKLGRINRLNEELDANGVPRLDPNRVEVYTASESMGGPRRLCASYHRQRGDGTLVIYDGPGLVVTDAIRAELWLRLRVRVHYGRD